MTNKKHVHKLKRLKFKTGNAVFFCTLPDCTFKINTQLALGKRAICWLCGNEFLMDEYNLRLAKPHCKDCHKSKRRATQDIITVPYHKVPEGEISLADKFREQSREQLDKGPSIFGLTKEIAKVMQQTEDEEPEI